jgi:hypothetical protein
MTSQERPSVNAAYARPSIFSDVIRSRFERGTRWAARRNGRVQAVLHGPAARKAAGREAADARFAGPKAAVSYRTSRRGSWV